VTTATAQPGDVRVEISTHLEPVAIAAVIDRVSRDIDRVMSSPPGTDTDDRQDLEAVLAALHIATSRDRAESDASTGRTSATYEESMIDELRARAKRLGAPDKLVSIGQAAPTAGLSVPDAKALDE
jgi:hypothetical protein